jgi:hypothetical protein
MFRPSFFCFAFLLPLLLTSCTHYPSSGQNAGPDSSPPKGILAEGPGFVGIIFPAKSAEAHDAKTMVPWTPSESDVLLAEKELVQFLKKTKDVRVVDILQKIGTYKRQYRGFISEDHKQIWIRFYCEGSSIDWTNREMEVFDGGTCYFGLCFSMETKTFSHLAINGLA